ncbi:flagellin [Neobacillus niacini]|uniref:flagellin N-terminal helical domain-containing protein n=1 Tax=Neobacillus niacini TaxID=86668 RepID=UPI0028642044|nr:flagellin [Neobacillus niacini]MDR7000999.1 flagellin [Neobacillus niacini]
MQINHNIAALNTYRQLNSASNAQSKSMEKLSSGLRINRAGDDAAGLAISEKMRGQIRGLDQASRNSQDGISMIQTAEGALNETHDILQRMRELATQSASDTNTDQDRKNIQSEMTGLTTEIDRIGNATQFNTKNLLDGSMGQAVNASTNNINTNTALAAATATGNLLTALKDSNGNSLGIQAGDSISISYVMNGTTVNNTYSVQATDKIDDIVKKDTDADGKQDAADANLGAIAFGGAAGISTTAAAAGTTAAINGLTVTVKDSQGNVRTAATNALSSFQETTQADNKRTDGSATLQIGANTNQNVNLSINDMRASALGVSGLQVTTQTQANTAMKVIDTAIQKVSSERGKLGALQNRLEHTINNLGTSSENLTAAESRIRDVDMAKEMMNQTKNSILSQAAQAMLAQANQQPQGVLQLLR